MPHGQVYYNLCHMPSHYHLNVARLYLILLLVEFSVVTSFKNIGYSDQKKQGKGNRRRKNGRWIKKKKS